MISTTLEGFGSMKRLAAALLGAGILATSLQAAHAADAPMAASAPMSSSASSAMAAGKEKSVSQATTRFMTKAAQGGMYEVEVAKLAADRAASDDVKKFAQMIVTDHTAANGELKTLAGSKGVTLPTSMAKKQQASIDKLSKMKGTAFDTAFVQQVGIKDHREDIALFDGYAKVPGDAEVKAFASKTLPTLRQHLSMAQELPKKMSGNGGLPHTMDTPKP